MLMSIFSVLVVLTVINAPFALLATRVLVNNHKLQQTQITIIERILCWIPVYNIYLFRVSLEASAPIAFVSTVFIYIAVILRLLALFVIKDPRFLLVTSCVFIVALILLWLLPACSCASLAKSINKTVYVIASVIAPPIGAFCLYLIIDAFYHNNKEVLDSTFDVED